jgi:hypothetical protein
VFAPLAMGQSECHANTRPSSFQSHHQTWLLRRSAPPFQFDAKGSVPAINCSSAMLDIGEVWPPNEGTMGKKPQIVARKFL